MSDIINMKRTIAPKYAIFFCLKIKTPNIIPSMPIEKLINNAQSPLNFVPKNQISALIIIGIVQSG